VTERRTSILVADDEFPTRNGVMSTIREWSGERIDVRCAENGLEALELIRERKPDLVVTDIRMPGLNGIELLERLRGEGIETPVILLTGYAEFEYAQKAVRWGACAYILKPVERDELIAAVEDGLARGGPSKRATEAADGTGVPRAPEDDVPRTRNALIRKALEYIHREYERPTLGIKELAEQIHLNPSYVSVLFKEETNQTFSDYVLGLRLRKAKELLLDTDMKIYEIAERTGFSTSKYFVKVFREKERLTPKQFREQAPRPL